MKIYFLLLLCSYVACGILDPLVQALSGSQPTHHHHHKHRTYGICDVRLPSSCPSTSNGSVDCKDALPTHSHKPFRWAQYNILSFNNLVTNGGHIGGRVATKNDVTINGGLLIGDQVFEVPTRKIQKYSLIAGGSASWNQGTLLPQNETAFVGSNFTAPSYLLQRLGASCAVAGCLNDPFYHAMVYYSALSSLFASLPSNVAVTYKYGGIYLSCGSPFQDGPTYVAQIDSSYLSGANWYSVGAECGNGPSTSWVLNIIGSGDVTFQGGAFPGVPERVLYNINGTGRSIVVSTGVNGNILAPQSSFSQSNGNTQGLVIAGDIIMISTANNPFCNHTYYSSNDVTRSKDSSANSFVASVLVFVIAAMFV